MTLLKQTVRAGCLIMIVGLSVTILPGAASASRPTWSIVPTPNPASPPGTQTLSAVSCASPTSCFAVGYVTIPPASLQPLIEHWDGTVWSVSLSPSVPNGTLTGVSCPSATLCLAVGHSGLIEQWNGSAWTVGSSPSPLDGFGAITCTATNFCFAVGSVLQPFPSSLIDEWNGTSWSDVSPTVAGFSGFSSVSCLTEGLCFSVGSASPGSRYESQTLIAEWNGSTWSTVASPSVGSNSSLSSVSCASGSCFAVGGNSGTSNQNLIEAWQGTAWSIVPGLRNRFAVTNGIWCASSKFCFAAGSKIVKKPTYYDQTFIAKWNGTRWFRLRSPNPGGSAELKAITCQGSTYCVAVGDSTPTLGALDTLVEQWAKDQ